MLKRAVSALGAAAVLAIVVALPVGLWTAAGARSWNRPVLAVVGGLCVAGSAVGVAAVTWRVWRDRMGVWAIAWVVVFVVGALLGGFLVLASTSTAYTPTFEVMR
jgi:hypothetical protein